MHTADSSPPRVWYWQQAHSGQEVSFSYTLYSWVYYFLSPCISCSPPALTPPSEGARSGSEDVQNEKWEQQLRSIFKTFPLRTSQGTKKDHKVLAVYKMHFLWIRQKQQFKRCFIDSYYQHWSVENVKTLNKMAYKETVHHNLKADYKCNIYTYISKSC